jgi:hypothetical protein
LSFEHMQCAHTDTNYYDAPNASVTRLHSSSFRTDPETCFELTSFGTEPQTLCRILPESCYIASAPTAQKTQFYCWLAPTAQKTSHAVAIVAWRLTAAEMCLPQRCLATSEERRGESWLLFLLFRVCFEVSVVQQFWHGANTRQYNGAWIITFNFS